MWNASCVYKEGNMHLHAGREGVSINKGNSYIDDGHKSLTGSSKRDAEEELDQGGSKRQKTGESLLLAKEPRDKEADELSQEELHKMMIIALGSTERSSKLEIILRKSAAKENGKAMRLQAKLDEEERHRIARKTINSCCVILPSSFPCVLTLGRARFPTQSPVADEAASTGVDVRFGGATTTVIGLEAGQGSGNIDNTPTMPHDLPLPRVNTHGNDEGSMTQQELMVFCTTLSKKKVESLETDLKQAKQIYSATYTKLIKKVKKLEKTTKFSQARRREIIVVSDDEDDLDDPSKQGRKITEIDQDLGISLVQHDAEIQERYGHDMEFDYDFDTAEKDVSTVRLQVELDEKESQRISRVHESASSFNVEE
nr:hypothetical protein [Tanacetum cinerariifolium]